MEADIRKTPLEDEFRYHEIITEIYNHHPVGRQAIRLIDIINTKASALLTHVSIMLAVSTDLERLPLLSRSKVRREPS
jgi:hypothetical protein